MSPSLLSRIQGCLVGAVVGDCLGAPFETMGDPQGIEAILDFVSKVGVSITKHGELQYTDDTAMARCVAQSLISNKGKLDLRDLGKRFAKEFEAEPDRGYGANVITVLKKLGDDNLSDVCQPARLQFDGNGSYGNGGAMRVAAVGVCDPNKFEDMVKAARLSAQITHSNKLGYNGAILQVCAVHLALHADHQTFDQEKYVSRLTEVMQEVENGKEKQTDEDSTPAAKRNKDNEESGSASHDPYSKESAIDDTVYCERLKVMKSFVQEEPTLKEVAAVLGNQISAHNSVGSAVYSFLRGLSPLKEVPVKNCFERTIIYAISLGGDTDTIASMAGAVAGAYHGIESIPQQWRKVCEGCDHALNQANELFEVYQQNLSEK